MKRDAMDIMPFEKKLLELLWNFPDSPLFVVVFGADESHKKVALQGSPLPTMSKSNHKSTSFLYVLSAWSGLKNHLVKQPQSFRRFFLLKAKQTLRNL